MNFSAKNLRELLAELNSMTDEQIEKMNGDFSSLPVFGDYDGDTTEIFSWDNDSFLTVDWNGNWVIEPWDIIAMGSRVCEFNTDRI